jgi:hypothetical protein
MTQSSPDSLRVEYPIVPLGELRVVPQAVEHGRRPIVSIHARGEVFQPAQRFWQSLFLRFGISDNIFRYFGHDEVFARIVERSPDDRLRLCIERTASPIGRLLAVSSPKRSLLDYHQAYALLDRHRDEQSIDDRPAYHDGVVSSTHTPRSGHSGFDIGPDRFHNRFVVEAPIDGFGQPRIFLSLLRLVCSNGAVGYARAFRSDIRIGEDAVYTLDRALSQFDHDEGFAALRQRFESAQKSWASIHEATQLQRALARSGSAGSKFQQELDKLCGDLHALYGLANLESLSVKRQRMLPARCRVYDLLNFASEIATHRAPPEARVRLQGFIGEMVSEEFDLEGTAEKVPEFQDLFMNLN